MENVARKWRRKMKWRDKYSLIKYGVRRADIGALARRQHSLIATHAHAHRALSLFGARNHRRIITPLYGILYGICARCLHVWQQA
jgi:hypothetical protein